MADTLFESQRLLFRPMEESDCEDCSRLVLEDSIFYWLGNETLSRSAAKKAWREMNEPGIFNVIMVLKETGGFCGRICMQNTAAPLPELGVAFLGSYRGMGLGPEAIRTFANWYGSVHGLSRLRVRISPENPHSLHVFSKLGALPQPAPPAGEPNDTPARPSREPLEFLLSLPL